MDQDEEGLTERDFELGDQYEGVSELFIPGDVLESVQKYREWQEQERRIADQERFNSARYNAQLQEGLPPFEPSPENMTQDLSQYSSGYIGDFMKIVLAILGIIVLIGLLFLIAAISH